MKFPETYSKLNIERVESEEYSLVPIRYEDRLDIMKWRNEQIYHLRQHKPLTKEEQENYFQTVVALLFEQAQPNQILFSYLKQGKCIGYGGLVHINWIDKNAEISFIMDTSLEKNEFKNHWGIYLDLLNTIAFEQLVLHKIYTYAFDLRPHLYEVLEERGFSREASLKEHYFLEGEFKDVVIHSKYKQSITIRPITKADVDFTYLLYNDPEIRKNSYSSELISYSNHKRWFQQKLDNFNSFYCIGEFNRKPVAFIRIDQKGDENVIGIALHKNYRGKKLSCIFLEEIVKLFKIKFPRKSVKAFIKNNNIASEKSFEKAGFKFYGNIEICKYPSKIYVYE